ncbi:transcriptional regulator BetI [Hahella sp. CCB-MM4]|uniref:choline-binding transcriptional repressor BetI n=1 Tax=Hahella sp. (strain CCB-MM4) TaxID=1926491 RepID=UPI000B9A2D61|nr:transcriptional regulator BetI [Hahella sp. CCB-MM4]OZG72138.1 transcriptional regulator BetI [Hahella sp. CCB-MM4]
MPKIVVEEEKREQLIEATLQSVEEYGIQGTTINRISQFAGVSTGIISHYFGGKQALMEATVRYLLNALQKTLITELEKSDGSPQARMMAIIQANFSKLQVSDRAAKTWLAFWAQAMHDPELARLQRVNEKRLFSNLKVTLREILPEDQVEEKAQTIAALIDGLWLRSALSTGGLTVSQAERICRNYVNELFEAQDQQ